MKVIGAGFPRTGTRTLKAALEELGFGPCYHMSEVFEHPEHARFWLRAAAGEPVDWDEVLGAYGATTDAPGAMFYRQLMEAYPDAPVLLSVRDAESWYRSCSNTIHAHSFPPGVDPHTSEDPVTRMIATVWWDRVFDGRFPEKERSIAIFERHNRMVQEHVPADRLLVYEAKQGWEPLCRFLGVEVPDTPFPHMNSTEEWRAREEAASS